MHANDTNTFEITHPCTVGLYSLTVDESAECGRALGACLAFHRFETPAQAIEMGRFLVRAEMCDEQAVVVRFDNGDAFEGIASVACIDGVDWADEL